MTQTTMTTEKLKLILARAEAKYEAGQALTVKEEQLLAELYRRRNERRREHVTVDADGTVRVNKTIDIEPVLEGIKAYGDFVDRHHRTKTAQKYAGSLDPITAANWARETGLKIGTREFAQFVMKRIKNDIDYRRFRVGGM